MNLLNAPIGVRLKITDMQALNTNKRFSDMGLTLGVIVTVLRKAPFGGCIEIVLRGFRLAVRRETAAKIIVKKVKN